MRTIRWKLDVGYPQVNISGDVDVEDTATDDEVEAEVREAMWNAVSLSWREDGK